ncbi:hypothetical protein OUZ56_001916 [Daphnia magna]|uniref:Uncharacterized protein n=1 Tax=Daphnia magna TaxID=35525 RepID=A0ABR0A4K2_9CRUS|nr:hypothetical protein OUZ56_001916 [Daphnia magna]
MAVCRRTYKTYPSNGRRGRVNNSAVDVLFEFKRNSMVRLTPHEKIKDCGRKETPPPENWGWVSTPF